MSPWATITKTIFLVFKWVINLPLVFCVTEKCSVSCEWVREYCINIGCRRKTHEDVLAITSQHGHSRMHSSLSKRAYIRFFSLEVWNLLSKNSIAYCILIQRLYKAHHRFYPSPYLKCPVVFRVGEVRHG